MAWHICQVIRGPPPGLGPWLQITCVLYIPESEKLRCSAPFSFAYNSPVIQMIMSCNECNVLYILNLVCTDERLTPDGRPNWIKGTSNYFNETLIVSGDVVTYNDDKVRRPRMTLLPKNRYGDVVSVTEFSIKTIQGVNTIVVSYEKNGTTTALVS